MRFMCMLKSDKDSEAGVPPTPEFMARMGAFLEEITKAGVLLATEGLHPSAKGVRLRFSGGTRTVTDGPFAETKELIASFALLKVNSMQEAIEWSSRFAEVLGGDVEMEIRQVYEACDFGPEVTPEFREADERRRAQLAAKK